MSSHPEDAFPADAPRVARVFGAYCLAAAALLLFVLLTVNRRSVSELQSNLLAQREHWAVTFWQQHGYLATGGMIALPAIAAGRDIGAAPFFFYRSSTGAWFLPPLLIANAARLVHREYPWRLISCANLLFPALSAALLALLTFRFATRLRLARLHAFLLGLSVLAIQFTFPDALSSFWEIETQGMLMPLFIAFLLIEDGCVAREPLRVITQAAVVFLMFFTASGTAAAVIASFMVVSVVLRRGDVPWRRWLMITVPPLLILGAFVTVQHAIVHANYPGIPISGSGVVYRAGLDGDTTHYTTHWDIVFGRDRVRAMFPRSRGPLFRWPALFFAGVLALIALAAAWLRDRIPTSLFIAVATLPGAYVLFAGFFSQAAAIHPYLYDYLLMTPLALALFGVLPAFGESVTRNRGIFVLASIFAAVWYTMVQLRDYAVRFPLP